MREFHGACGEKFAYILAHGYGAFFEGAPVITPGHRSPAWALWVGLVEPFFLYDVTPRLIFPCVGGSDHHETSMKLTGFTILRFGPLAACFDLWSCFWARRPFMLYPPML